MDNIYQRAINIFNNNLKKDIAQVEITPEDVGKVIGIVGIENGKPVFGPVAGSSGNNVAIITASLINDELVCSKTFTEVYELAADDTVVVLKLISGEVPISTYFELAEATADEITFARVYKYPAYAAFETCVVDYTNAWTYNFESLISNE